MILTGYPRWVDPTDSRDQQMAAKLTLQVVQHFAAAGLPLWAVGPTAEVDVAHSPQDVADLNFAVAKALSGTGTAVAAPNSSYMMGDYMQASAQTMGALLGAGTWDEYPSGDMWSAPARAMNEAQGSCANARKILDAA